MYNFLTWIKSWKWNISSSVQQKWMDVWMRRWMDIADSLPEHEPELNPTSPYFLLLSQGRAVI